MIGRKSRSVKRRSRSMEQYPRIILGAGKQAGHVLHLLEAMGLPWKDAMLFDDRYEHSKQGTRDLAILGTLDDGIRVCRHRQLPAIVALGSTFAAVRYATFQKAIQAGVRLVSLIHPSCVIAPSASIGRNVVMMPGCVVGSDTRIGSLSCFFSNATLEHDCRVGDNVVMGPGVALSGFVQVGAHCFLGTGVVCLPEVKIEERVLVGSGAVVVTDLPSGSVCFGVPACARREVRPGDDVPTEAQLLKLCSSEPG